MNVYDEFILDSHVNFAVHHSRLELDKLIQYNLDLVNHISPPKYTHKVAKTARLDLEY